MKKTPLFERLVSLLVCVALLATYSPLIASAATSVAAPALEEAVADPGTAHSWENMMGTHVDGNRYAGRVWVDKSVYKNGDTVVLNSKAGEGSSFKVELAEDEAFQIVFSALGSTMTTRQTISSSGPLDVVLVLDDSTSMDDMIAGNTTRLEKLIEASNKLLANLSEMQNIRIGIVAYNQDAMQILPFGAYSNGIELRVRNNKYIFDENNRQDKGGTIQAFDKNGTMLYNNTAGYNRGTNTQSGINMGMGMLEKANNTQGRTPVAIVLTDGAANTAAQNTFYNIEGQTPRSIFTGTPASVVLATLLNASYKKVKVTDHYGKAPMIYGIGVDIAGDAAANAVINPGAEKDGFNNANSSRSIIDAYKLYTDWLKGDRVERTESYIGNHTFTFDHGYTGVTAEQIRDNINYVDTYYPVSSAELDKTFQQIYEELSSGVFNPISSSTSVSGGTGVDDTPLIYVDIIGQHMQIKEIQSVTLFGASYGVVKNADGTYTVTEATGSNPTTNERWNTAEDIRISVTEQAEGTQKLEIRINQEILPIILEQVISETVGGVSSSTITEYTQDPLRVYYTVGVDSDILLPNGQVDISKLQGYKYIDDASGTVSFYSNQFGVMNPADGSGVVAKGDAHVGFQPSKENRYYYHQTNQGIFTKISDKNGNTVTIPENNEYGIIWNEDDYELTWMSYEEYKNVKDSDKVYTYVSYYCPTPSTTDAANAAEVVTYLVYTNWKYLKESVAFYDAEAKEYLNNGEAIAAGEVDSTIATYRQSHPSAELYAVLGTGSRRTSRLHNMMVDKVSNSTRTAVEHYTPEYLENKAQHNDNDVVVWLGNNGKLTVDIETGIALTKTVTEEIGTPDDTYSLTVTVPAGVTANPRVVDTAGNTIASSYQANVLTVNLKAGQTAYISGIPGGTDCAIGETVNGDYYIESKTDTVRVPLVSEVLSGAAQFAPAVVTNAPNRYGNLFITKEITSDHAVPENVLDTEFTFTVNVGTALAGKVYTVEDSAHTAPYSVTVGNDGTLVFRLKARQTVEIFHLPEGTAVTVTEQTPDSHFSVSYRTRNHSGEAADADNALVIPANGNATVVVINHYTPTATTVDLDVVINKNFADASVADRLTGGDFRFLVEKYWADTGSWTQMATQSVSYGANEYGKKSVAVENVLRNEVYSQVGTYSYRVTEVKGDVANISYDRIAYTFDVIVTDNGGQLAATAVGMNNTEIKDENSDGALDYITEFVNTYETAPISMDIIKKVINTSGDTTVSAQGFKFQSISVDQNGNPLNTPENIVFSDAVGQARISGVYTKQQIGTHYYIIYEADEGKPGWTYSEAQYFVTVVVAQDNGGKLSATMTIVPWNDAARKEAAPTVTDNNKGQIFFTNTYDPENITVDLDGHVTKVLTGKELEDEQFTFYVYQDGQRTNPILTGTNKKNGNVHFVDFDKDLTFTGIGKYQYDVVESIPSGAVYDAATGKYILHGMHYDATIYDLVVEVRNDVTTGKLTANFYFEDAVSNVVTFHNSYHAIPVEYALGGAKVLHGRAPRNDEFAFELNEGDTCKQTVTNKADGSFSFAPITYTGPGTYTYTIKEKGGNVAGVSYDGTQKPVTVTVTVKDVGGVLRASADRANTDIKFENTYTAKAAQVIFNGTKTLAGGTLEDNTFSFGLYKTDNSFDITNSFAELLSTAKNVNGAFTFARELNATGTYYFVIVEDASAPVDGVVYDCTQHRLAVRVSDNGDGQLKAVVTNMVTGVSSVRAASVATDVTFTNALVEEATKKEVYLEGTTTEIDGRKVNEGDILTYFITYTNYTGENVVVDIMDTIPNHTSYVDGSASRGGTYAGTHLNWILNVAKGESVTVSFRVRVNASQVVVPNTAVIRDGVNVYHTNEVVNHTVENVLQKDVFSTKEVAVSINGEKVQEGDELIYQISFTNTSGDAAAVTITDKLPANTTYVAGSADNGGVYENGAIIWKVGNVPAWSTVTVAFKVTVNEEIGAATIRNQATATDGTNQYETNWVTNYTEVREAPNPTDKPGPQTGDNSKLQLWVALLIVSSGGILATSIYGRKKKETKE